MKETDGQRNVLETVWKRIEMPCGDVGFGCVMCDVKKGRLPTSMKCRFGGLG